MLHSIHRYLLAEGDVERASVITTRPPRRHDTFQGVRVSMIRDPRRARMAYRDVDVILTHLDSTRQAVACANRECKPIVHLVHNDRQLDFHKVARAEAQLVCFNSRWIAEAVRWEGPSMVLNPPVWTADYPERDGPHDAVLLLNLAPAKGAETFYEMARRFPETRFLAVQGAYAAQVPPPADLGNVTLVGNTPDVASLYAEARVVLMPSHYESWGRVAVEAASAAVPTIACPTPGLRETGIPDAFAEHDDYDRWETLLGTLLSSDETWEHARRGAQQRARELEDRSREQLAEFSSRLRDLC
jgi:glycosyltransferase involved in cell wall biosynthesis